jgi:thiosulfate reductase cytochrome b subunit
MSETASTSKAAGHRRWVRICHWIAATSFLTLALSGFFILLVHPRLYLGHAGNDLTPALLTLPIGNDLRPDKMQSPVIFTELPGAPVTAERNFPIFNQNGWARSLHFLAAWFLWVRAPSMSPSASSAATSNAICWPQARELAPRALLQDVKNHLRPVVGAIGAGPPYGLMQKLAYTTVVLIALPLMVATGLTIVADGRCGLSISAGSVWRLPDGAHDPLLRFATLIASCSFTLRWSS